MFLSILTAKDHRVLAQLGDFYRYDRSAERDYEAALDYYKRAAHQHKTLPDLEIKDWFFDRIDTKCEHLVLSHGYSYQYIEKQKYCIFLIEKVLIPSYLSTNQIERVKPGQGRLFTDGFWLCTTIMIILFLFRILSAAKNSKGASFMKQCFPISRLLTISPSFQLFEQKNIFLFESSHESLLRGGWKF